MRTSQVSSTNNYIVKPISVNETFWDQDVISNSVLRIKSKKSEVTKGYHYTLTTNSPITNNNRTINNPTTNYAVILFSVIADGLLWDEPLGDGYENTELDAAGKTIIVAATINKLLVYLTHPEAYGKCRTK